MCGIAGIVGSQRVDVELLHRMCDSIRHRGPDDEGYFVEGGVGLGMRRLSIIDVAAGHQPIANEDGTVVVVFNGEIYNFAALRLTLESRGHRFSTKSDTECLVHLYEDEGDDFVRHLRGMFAFALWDRKRERLLLGRDRVGKKPLFYRLTPDGIAFASEMKALVQDRTFVREVDPLALHDYLTLQYVPAPQSILKGVRKLSPAHVLTWQSGKVDEKRYWRLSYADKSGLDETAVVEELSERIIEAVGIRLVGERPIGAFLSGGVDSSVVVAAMAQQSSGAVKTFSIGFDDARFDERSYARLVADRFGTEHHEFVVTPSAAALLPTLAWHYDEPFADASAIPTYYVARLTSEHVTVALNGDGGDESFGGYDRYVANAYASRLPIPPVLRRLARLAGHRLPLRGDARSASRRASSALAYLGVEPSDRYAHMMSYFRRDEKSLLYTDDMRAATAERDTYDILTNASSSCDSDGIVDRMLCTDVETYLPGDLLVKVDIATMANSLEARSPFLDHTLMEFAASLPAQMKVSGRVGKRVLKSVARQWLPADVIDRPKMGFGVPIARWLREDLRELVHDSLTDETARARGYFEPKTVKALIASHEAGNNESTRLWALLQFELWHRLFIDSAATAAPPLPAL